MQLAGYVFIRTNESETSIRAFLAINLDQILCDEEPTCTTLSGCFDSKLMPHLWRNAFSVSSCLPGRGRDMWITLSSRVGWKLYLQVQSI